MLPSPMNPTGVLEAIDLEHTTARLAAAGRGRWLQYRRPEAAPRSHKEAASLAVGKDLPPPSGPAPAACLSRPDRRGGPVTGRSAVGLGCEIRRPDCFCGRCWCPPIPTARTGFSALLRSQEGAGKSLRRRKECLGPRTREGLPAPPGQRGRTGD